MSAILLQRPLEQSCDLDRDNAGLGTAVSKNPPIGMIVNLGGDSCDCLDDT
ncbi:MAG: hypothetical protein PHH36_05560 [Sideroxydans sp.]|nr:hypothetical protein [Sideroxydans sp.]